MSRLDQEYEIPCLAVDGKIHNCLPWKGETVCEEKLRVVKKQMTGDDRIGRFSCYECTF